MSREIYQTISIDNTPENIFNALLNPSAIIEWWQAKTAIVIKENNGIYCASWGDNIDDPDYVTSSKIRDLVDPQGFTLEYLSYFSKTGKMPFEAKMYVHFSITPDSKSNTILAVRQTGFPDDPVADEYFEGCQTGWNHVLTNIKTYCEKN